MDRITLNHGNGGRESHQLIAGLFTRKFGMTEPLTDAAALPSNGELLAFTTDSYVVDPVFFPGGNIGTLAICGTVNDLAVSGAVPAYISASFILEEGLAYSDLEAIVTSMAEEAIKGWFRKTSIHGQEHGLVIFIPILVQHHQDFLQPGKHPEGISLHQVWILHGDVRRKQRFGNGAAVIHAVQA